MRKERRIRLDAIVAYSPQDIGSLVRINRVGMASHDTQLVLVVLQVNRVIVLGLLFWAIGVIYHHELPPIMALNANAMLVTSLDARHDIDVIAPRPLTLHP